MKLRNLFKRKEKKAVEDKKVRFIFELPENEMDDFINKIWATRIFSVVLTQKELDGVEKMVTKGKKEVVFGYEN